MSSSFSVPALPHIQKLHAYTPGLQPTESGWVKLNTNECPYPPSPRVAAAITAELGDGESLRLYPNPTSAPLRRVVAKLHGLTEENVLIGNGSDDVLNLLVRVFGGPTAATGVTIPSYSLYPVLVAINDGSISAIEFDRSMKLPLEKIAASGARAFFLTSPNAPTGVAFTNAELSAVLSTFSGILVVDEAYAPFAEQNAVPLLAKHPNLVITRTLSKAHALAGIRVGYALASAEVIGLLDRVRDSYNVGEWAGKLGWFIYPTQTNFIFAEPKNAKGETGPAVAKSLYDFFVAQKILVRAFPSHALTAPFLRISVGSDDEMFAVNKAIEAWLAT